MGIFKSLKGLASMQPVWLSFWWGHRMSAGGAQLPGGGVVGHVKAPLPAAPAPAIPPPAIPPPAIPPPVPAGPPVPAPPLEPELPVLPLAPVVPPDPP